MSCQIQINPQALADWEQIASKTVIASASETGQLLPINSFDLEVSIDSRFIAVQAISQSAKSNWVAAGYLAQKYNFPGFSTTLKGEFVRLSLINLIEIKNHGDYFCTLIFNPRHYLEDIQVIVWRYIGEEISFLETTLSNFQGTLESFIDNQSNSNLFIDAV